MPNVRDSQLALIAVDGGSDSNIRSSQMALIAVETPNTPINVSQLALIVVTGDGPAYVDLDNVIRLGCWTPCGIMMQNRSLF